jgi:hypothetical protein
MLQPAVPIISNWPKLTLFIQTPTKVITESHWYTSINALQACMAEANNLINMRRALLGDDAKLVAVRGSLENVFGDSLINPKSLTVVPNGYGPCDPGDSNILMRLESGSFYRKSLFLSGVPDLVIQSSVYTPQACQGYSTAMTNWSKYLAPKGPTAAPVWGFLARNKTAIQCPQVQVLVIQTDPTGKIASVTCAGDPLLDPTDPTKSVVLLSRLNDGTRNYPEFNGLWNVDSVPAPGNFNFVGSFVPNQTYFMNTGFARKAQKILCLYTNAVVRAIGGHKRGNRALTPLGRRKKARVTLTQPTAPAP